MAQDTLSPDFTTTPFWWKGFEPPEDAPGGALPRSVDVAVVGAGYTGISCARTLAENGVNVLVLDSGRLGRGASTRSGGQITGGVNIGKNPTGKNALEDEAHKKLKADMLRECASGMTHLEHLIERYGIDCGYHRTGRLTAFWKPEHYEEWKKKLGELNALTEAGAFMVPPEKMRDEIASDAYFGGTVITRAGHLQPAQFYGGVLGAARSHGAQAFGMTEVIEVKRQAAGYEVHTNRGAVKATNVVLATNGYPSAAVGRLRRQVIPVTSHMIATEEMPVDLARSLIPHNRAVAETRRVTNHYRLSPDGRRMMFGGRARFTSTDERTTARLLRNAMVDRFPQLSHLKITNSWEGNIAVTFDFLPHIGEHEGMHYAMGCNGSGVVMMTYLGHRIGLKILGGKDAAPSAYDSGAMPEHPLYYGNPWFMAFVGSWYQWRDAIDKRRAHKGRSSR
jgi:glycine/D-amino acid oxidase-like deaminating enzyme